MSLARRLDRDITGAGTVRVEADGSRVEAEVTEAGPVGVRLRRLRVEHDAPRDLLEEAETLPKRTRALGERLVPVEVDPRLGGGVLRTDLEDMRGREFFELSLGPGHVEVGRQRVVEDGREEVDFALTREQLERLVEGLQG